MIQLDQIKKLIRLIQTVPTGDNCQPFEFVFLKSKNTLQVIYIKKLAEHILNPDEMASLISLGMIDFIISNSGINVKEKKIFLNEMNKDNELVAEYILDENSFIDESFCEICFKRSTYRDKFSKKVLDIDIPNDVVFQKEVSQDFIKSMLNLEDNFWKRDKILKDVFHWVNMNLKEHMNRRRGLYWKELGVTWEAWIFLAIVKNYPRLAIWVYRMIVSKIIKNHLDRIYTNSSFLFVTVSQGLDHQQRFFELGKKTMRVWIELTRQKISAQPLSFYTFHQEPKGSKIKTKFFMYLKSIVKEENVFIWIFRIGHTNKEFLPKEISQRAPLEQVLKVI